jgi:TolB-like protein
MARAMSSESVTHTTPRIPDYELARPIGGGSYGDVWLARGVTGLWRAVKIVWRARFADPEPFEREFRGLKEFAAISLGESIQLALLHIGRNDAEGFFYYVMELADDAERGRAIEPASYVPLTLAELRARRGRLAAGESVRFGVELARVLASLHRRGLVHRDIKPSNVILVSGVPKLADIGLVAPSSSARTFIGTEGFVPPEGPGSPAADVFALGKVLYELATGLDRNDFPQLPPALDELPDAAPLIELNKIILRACDPQPARRFEHGGALLEDLEALHAGKPVRRRGSWPLAIAAALVLAGGAIGWSAMGRRPSGAGPAPAPRQVVTAPAATAIAVLPFVNLSGDTEQDYFSDGLSSEILDLLARERDLRVVGRTSTFAFKGKNAPLAEIAQALGVTRLVEGTVQRVDQRVRIRVQLTRTDNGATENVGSFEEELTDVFALQDKIARAVVAKVAPRSGARVTPVLTTSAQAYDAYLRGRALQTRAASATDEAATFYKEAVNLDPAFALAWARLAEAIIRPFSGQSDQRPERAVEAREAIDRALELQPDLPEALVARAIWFRNVAYDFTAARRDLARAEALQPPSAQHRIIQAILTIDAGDWPEAMRLARQAVALDPQNGDTANVVASVFLTRRGEFAEADRLLARAMVIQGPSRAAAFLSRLNLRTMWRGPEAALRLLDRAPAGQRGQDARRLTALVQANRIEAARALVDEADRDADSSSPTAGAAGEFLARASLGELEAVGRLDLVQRRAEKMRSAGMDKIARGDRAVSVRNSLVRAEIALGYHEAALALLEEWRADTAQRPSANARVYEFNRPAARLYARLGRADEACALLREMAANGYVTVGFEARDSVDYAPIRSDPRIQEFIRHANALAAAQPDPVED